MRARSKQSAVTLTEMTVVIAAVALLVVFGLPAVRAFMDSFQSQAGARAMISAALASARAVAAREQHYVGIRFQKAYHPQDPLNAPQYMIFIIHDQPNTKLANGFRAVEGIEPIKLPDSVGVMDLKVVTRTGSRTGGVKCKDEHIDMDSEIDELEDVNDTTAFSIIFSPSGKLVKHRVETSNRDGVRQPRTKLDSMDSVFNGYENIRDNNIGTFIQDYYFNSSPPDLGYGPELSRNSFIIYDRSKFKEAFERRRAYSDCLEDLESSMIYINPYTGTLINR
jgi:type II secretory pathway pseudopilin PulG